MVMPDRDREGNGICGKSEQGREFPGSPCVPVPARRSPSEPRPSLASGGEAERRPEGGPARWEPEGLSPDPSMGIHPRSVTPGIENQNRPNQVPIEGMTCRPDWMRFVGPEIMQREVVRLLRRWFGHLSTTNHGAKYFDHGTLWHPGVLFSQGHSSKVIMIDIQGGRLSSMNSADAIKLASEIMMLGFRCTRIDLAVDHVGMDLQLHEHALKSCKAGELCKLRSYADDSEFKADGTPVRYLLKLGKRDSAICARLYDKGLETKLLPAGQWERLEIEFKDDRAAEVCMTLCNAEDRMHEALWRYVIGAIDFREVNGRTELARRPRAKWWTDYIGSAVPLDCPPCPKESSFDTWWKWARTSFAARFLQISEIMGVSPESLLAVLTEGLIPARSESPATIDLRARVGQNNVR